MTPADTQVTRLVSRLRSMPQSVARQFLREAAADVCARTHCWLDTIKVRIQEDWNRSMEVPLPEPPPWTHARVYREGPSSRRAFVWTGTGFRCLVPFAIAPCDTVAIQVELIPDTQGMALEDMPEHVWNMAGNAILETAVARAAGQVGKPWGDAIAYQNATRMAADEVNRLVNTVVRPRTGMRIYQPPPIGELG